MRIIRDNIEKINNEIDDAKEYAEKYVEEKAKENMTKANKYREMSNDELKHAGYIHDFTTSEISEIQKVYTAPIEMLDKWDHEHKKYVEKVAWIKQMLSM